MHGTDITSTSNSLLVTFVVEHMTSLDDQNNFLMRNVFKFIPGDCEDASVGRGGGQVSLSSETSTRGCQLNKWSVDKVTKRQVYI